MHGAGHPLNLTDFLVVDSQAQLKVCEGQHALRLLWPFCDFQAGAGKQIAKTSFFKFLGIVETVKIEMPNGQGRLAAGENPLMRFNHGISWTFDAALDTQ